MNRTHADVNPAASAPADPKDERGPEALRAAFWAAFEMMGGVQSLVDWGHAKPAEFYRAYARLAHGSPASARSAEAGYADVSDRPLTEEEWVQSVAHYRS
jgi:hypothetical protein